MTSHSEQLNELAAALVKAQSEMRHAQKDARNGHFDSNYATLASAIDACRPALNSHGLSIVQLVCSDSAEVVTVDTRLLHTSGQWIGSRLSVPVVKRDPQGHGSAITYARRYGLLAIVGLAADDDDGNDASRKPEQKPEARKEPPPVHRLLAGPQKGYPVTDASDEALTEYIAYCEAMLGDKSKARNHATARDAIAAAGAEIERRITQSQRGQRG